MAEIVASDTVIIEWTVPVISFTPETYIVHYGRSRNTDLSSSHIESGAAFNTPNLNFSVVLSGLLPSTVYYYKVSTTNAYGSSESDLDIFVTFEQCKSSSV